MDINNLIDKIIDQQVKIKEALKNKRYRNIYEEDAITHLDKANRFLIEVKYMLSQTNYHKKQLEKENAYENFQYVKNSS